MMMREHKEGGANAWDIDATIAEYKGQFRASKEDEPVVEARDDPPFSK